MVRPINESVGLLWGVTPAQLRALQRANFGKIGQLLKAAEQPGKRRLLLRVINNATINRLAKLAKEFLDGGIDTSVDKLRKETCAKFKKYLSEYDKKSNRKKRSRDEDEEPVPEEAQKLLETRVNGVPEVLSRPATGQGMKGVDMRLKLSRMGLSCGYKARVSTIQSLYDRVHRLNPYLVYPHLLALAAPLEWSPNDSDNSDSEDDSDEDSDDEPELTEAELMKFKKDRLVEMCEARELDASGTKKVLAARIHEADAAARETKNAFKKTAPKPTKKIGAVSLGKATASKHGAKLAADMLVRTEDNDAFAAEDAEHLVEGEQVLMTVENPKRPESLIPTYDNVDMRRYEGWCGGGGHRSQCAQVFFNKQAETESATTAKVFWDTLDDLVLTEAKTPPPLPPADQWLVLSDRLDLTEQEFKSLRIDPEVSPNLWKVGKFSAATIAEDFIYELFPSVPCEVIGRISEFFDAIERDEADLAEAAKQMQNAHIMPFGRRPAQQTPTLENDTLARYSVLVNARELVRRVRALANKSGWCNLDAHLWQQLQGDSRHHITRKHNEFLSHHIADAQERQRAIRNMNQLYNGRFGQQRLLNVTVDSFQPDNVDPETWKKHCDALKVELSALYEKISVTATLTRLWQRQAPCSFLMKAEYLDDIARAKPQSLAPNPAKVRQRIRESDALFKRLEKQMAEDEDTNEREEEEEIRSLLRRQTSLFNASAQQNQQQEKQQQQEDEDTDSTSVSTEAPSEEVHVESHEAATTEKKEFDKLLAKLSKLKSKVLLKERGAMQDDDDDDDDEADKEDDLFKLADGIAPYQYQQEYLRWAFGIERQVRKGKLAGGNGMQLNMGLVDLEWRGTGLCHEYHSGRDGNGRLVQFPLLLDLTHARLCVRPSNFDEFATLVQQQKLRTFSAAGGVLSDEVGLGKSFSMICLANLNRRVMPTVRVTPAEVGVPNVKQPKRKRAKKSAKSAVKEPVLQPASDGKMLVKQVRVDRGHVLTGATLIMTPNHLVGQWQSEVTKMTRVPESKVIVLSTKPQHESVNVYDLVQAEFVIVSYNFLGGKYYCGKFGVDGLGEYDPKSKAFRTPWTKAPSLAVFDWHRIVVDESHELFRPFQYNTEQKLNHLKSARTRAWGYVSSEGCKWALSATPFSDASNGSLYGYFKYLDMRLNGTPMVQLNWADSRSGDRYNNRMLLAGSCNRYYGQGNEQVSNTPSLPAARTDWPARLFERALLRRQTRKSIGLEDETPPFEEEVHEIDGLVPEQMLHDTCTSTQEKVLATSLPQLLLQRHYYGYMFRNRNLNVRPIKVDEVVRQRIDVLDSRVRNFGYQIDRLQRQVNDLDTLLEHWRGNKNAGNPARLLGGNYFQYTHTVSLASMEREYKMRKLQLAHHTSLRDSEQAALNKLRKYANCRLNKDMPKPKPMNDVTDLDEEETFTRLRVLIGSKLAYAARHIQRLLKESDEARIVLFSAQDQTLQLVVALLNEYKITCVTCRGNVWQRRKALAAFSQEGKLKKGAARVLAMSLKSSASGTNLLNSTHVFLLDALVGTREQVRAQEMQAVGRGSRQGMEHPVKVVRMLVRGSKEYELWQEYRDEESALSKKNENDSEED